MNTTPNRHRTQYLTHGALIASLYVLLTWLAHQFGLDSGAIQIRLSEALTILPCFTPAAIPGLAIGCLIANILSGCALWDVIFGTLATLLGAIGTRLLRKFKWLAPLPPIVANILIVPYVLAYVYGAEGTISFFMLTVGAGELICCGVLGLMLYSLLDRYRRPLALELN